MSIDVTEVRAWASVSVTVKLDPATTEPVKSPYGEGHFQPDYMSTGWRYDTVTGSWLCTDITVVGCRILKPAPDGTKRLGKDHRKRSYGGWSRDVLVEGEAPETLVKLARELQPSGELTLPGGG